MDMLTPQNFREKTFERAIFGGYDMGSVDDFLEEAASDYATLARESLILKNKMKVLVEKIEEYRETEETMRQTLLSAQRLSTQIEGEARTKADSIIAEAKAEAERITREAHNQRNDEEAKLIDIKRESAQYIENIRIFTVKQLDMIHKLSSFHREATKADAPPPGEKHPDVEDTVRSIENSVERMDGSSEENREIGKTVSDTKDSPDSPFVLDSEPTRMFSGDNPASGSRNSFFAK